MSDDQLLRDALAAARTNTAHCCSGRPETCAAAKTAVAAVLALCATAEEPGDRLESLFGFRPMPERVSTKTLRTVIREAGVK